ncbi:DUF4232 domain-containing protein [Amycolatopsis sp. PS_44_ISF1]|uniref:DUF4232 domain-containing protein n=1 Tax=Amycolatopsis sp. PS_44_ISF1 TaxID=2974917 RepID=UPI0028DDDF80|nr:DUF4232 domain-containing protein [Amycolatopsis sp. PS_44_ISF1]MDT8912551.1 DUF4232 domain-containing protein [Amycolatopsis sp. PS_44_ISF1]
MVGARVERMAIGTAAVAGAFALTACGSAGSGPVVAPVVTSAAPTAVANAALNGSTSSTAPAGSVAAAVPVATKALPATAGNAPAGNAPSGRVPAGTTPRCTTADLSASLGPPLPRENAPGQADVPLSFTNTSSGPCELHGVPGVDLVGPADPNGTTYHLPRVGNGGPVNVLAPGRSATATVTVLAQTPGAIGSSGSTNWTPARLVTIPPGQTQPLTVAWPPSLTVLRQDAATHPGSFVNGIFAEPPA